MERGKELRAPTGAGRGRSRGSKNRPQKSPESTPEVSEPGKPESEQYSAGDEFERDWAQHSWFRIVCSSCGNFSMNRPLYLQQILLFVAGADAGELAEIRITVVRQTKMKRSRRGRRGVREHEEIMGRAREVAWRRIIMGQLDLEIAGFLKMPVRDPIRSASGLTEVPGNTASAKRQVQRLEDYLAAAIWDAIPPNCVRVVEGARQIDSGALDDKRLQSFIGHRTGLPFGQYPEECRRIVEALWPRGCAADWRLFERGFAYRQKKQQS
jgi:hypothetical protein